VKAECEKRQAAGEAKRAAKAAADKILDAFYKEHPKPGNTSRADSLIELGVGLIRLYRRFHPSGEFKPGERRSGMQGLQYRTPAARWFDAVIRAIVPDIIISEVNTTIKDALATANSAAGAPSAPSK
jgi:hypothetical protein